MKFLIALVDPDPLTAARIHASIKESVETVPYMIGRTDILSFNSLADCEAAIKFKTQCSQPPINVVFVNTDSTRDYKYPLQKLGAFSTVIKVSEEPEMNILFHKQSPADYLTLPMSVVLTARIMRSCCAVNRLSPEYIASTLRIEPTIEAKPETVRIKRKPCKKGVSQHQAGIKAAARCNSMLRENTKGNVPTSIGMAVEDLLMLPLEEDSNFSSGLMDAMPEAAANGSVTRSGPVPFAVAKMVVSYDSSTMALQIVKADSTAEAMLALSAGAANVDMTRWFGCATDHKCIQDIHHSVRQCLSIVKYITIYLHGKPVPMLFALSPVTRRASTDGVGISVVSMVQAGYVGFLKMKAIGAVA